LDAENKYYYELSLQKLKTEVSAKLDREEPLLSVSYGYWEKLKNLFGLMPGSYYGWPKNVLHYAGLQESILDINATVRPQFAIVDGIVGMEGNGPLQGRAKNAGVLIFGDDFVSVDASATRLMKLEPRKVIHLAKADAFLGNLAEEKIAQIGEKLESLQQDFEIIEDLQDLKKLTG
ncbi:MAG: DUF362 domain-containing protein, partial [Candidatus Binatia bacterium]